MVSMNFLSKLVESYYVNFIQFCYLVRRSLMAIALLLALSAAYLLVTSVILMTALRKEHELKFRHWLRAMTIFICFRFITIIYQSIVNVSS